MEQRISDEQLRELGKGMAADPRHAAFVGSKVVIALILDLDDSRSEVSRLQGDVERLQGLIENSKDGGK